MQKTKKLVWDFHTHAFTAFSRPQLQLFLALQKTVVAIFFFFFVLSPVYPHKVRRFNQNLFGSYLPCKFDFIVILVNCVAIFLYAFTRISGNFWTFKQSWPSLQKEYFVEFVTAGYFKLHTTQGKPGKCIIIEESRGKPGKHAFFYFWINSGNFQANFFRSPRLTKT